MAAVWSWASADDQASFETHYNAALHMSDAEPKIVSCFDGMKKVMHRAGVIETLRLQPHLVGISEHNRDGKMMSASEKDCKGSKIVNVGASVSLCGPDRAWAAQEDPSTLASFHWTKKHADASDRFGPASSSIMVGSLGCSHVNQFLHSINSEIVTDVESLWQIPNKHGTIDKTHILANDPVLADLAQNGMTWSVIDYRFLKAYPKLPSIWQKALNVEHHIAMGESWDQQISQIVSLAVSAQGDVKWNVIANQVRSAQGPNVGDLNYHISFVRKYGGGSSMMHMKQTLQVLNAKMPAGRHVAGNWIKTLAEVPLSSDLQLPRFLHATLRTHACCSEADCDEKTARFIPGPDIKSLTGKHKSVALQAEGILKRLHEALECSNRTGTLEFVEFEAEVVKSVFAKSKTPRNLTDIASELVMKHFGVGSEASSSASHQDTTIDTAAPTLIEFTESGTAVDIGKVTVLQAGFHVGSLIGEKKLSKSSNAIQYKICNIFSDGSVSANAVDTSGAVKPDATTIDRDTLMLSYKVLDAGKKIEIDTRPSMFGHEVINIDLMRGAVHQAMVRRMRSMTCESDMCRFQTSPTRAVFASAVIKADQRIMIPLTTLSNIKHVSKDDVVSSMFTSTVQTPAGLTEKFWFKPFASDDCVSLVFSVNAMEKGDSCNLEIEHVSDEVTMWADKSAKYKVTIPVVKAMCDIDVDTLLVIRHRSLKVKGEKRQVAAVDFADKQAKKAKK